MSEYQYYEFLRIDRPLTDEEMVELRSISSRAEISRTRFCNTYNYGGLSASPRRMMEKYFDAHVYVSNWGVFNFMLRLPHGVIPEAILNQYAADDELAYWTTDERIILSWFRNDEAGVGWVDGEGWMARLAPIREEIERADHRSLYIGWLAAVQYRLGGHDEEAKYDYEETENSIDDFEPSVPPGLGSLSTAQMALVEFLDIDSDLVKAAAMASPEAYADADADKRMVEWVAQVPDHEAKEFLLMVLRDEGRKAERQIKGQYHEYVRVHGQVNERDAAPRRTLDELRNIVKEVRKERKRQEALERERKLAERERQRREYLARVADNLPQWWQKADAYAEEKNASAYDSARDAVVDLRDAYKQAGRLDEFTEIFEEFISKHARRPALLRRLKEAGMPCL
jgi:hypothetical protein